jgi:tight adherence protein C
MRPEAWGAVLGLTGAVGVVFVVSAAPSLRRSKLADRLAPYLRDTARPSALLARTDDSTVGAVRRIVRPFAAGLAGRIDEVLGGASAVRRRLNALGVSREVEDFRIEQVIWSAAGGIGGAVLGVLLGELGGGVDVLAALLLAAVGLLVGGLARDWWLSVQVTRREARIMAEFPVVAELLALAITAGEGPGAALERVCRLCRGELGRELGGALAEARAGAPLVTALEGVAERTSLDTLARFVEGIVVALERGTPLADVVRAQAGDVREAQKRALLATGGRKEIAMLLPVVFLILPVTVLFALYPGLVNLTLLTR